MDFMPKVLLSPPQAASHLGPHKISDRWSEGNGTSVLGKHWSLGKPWLPCPEQQSQPSRKGFAYHYGTSILGMTLTQG
jgi:hypothetical protein